MYNYIQVYIMYNYIQVYTMYNYKQTETINFEKIMACVFV